MAIHAGDKVAATCYGCSAGQTLQTVIRFNQVEALYYPPVKTCALCLRAEHI